MTVAAIVVAAGSGDRLGAGVPKAMVEVAGVPLVRAAVDRLVEAGVDTVVVVAPADHLRHVEALLPPIAGVSLHVVEGGATRTASVAHGLDALDDGVEVIVVHDAARAFTPAATIREALGALVGDVVASAPGVAVADTIKQVSKDRDVVGTVDRTDLVAIQTPQVFRGDVLRAAHASGTIATDDIALVEELLALGSVEGRIVVTTGSPLATKITWPHDMAVLEALLEVSA